MTAVVDAPPVATSVASSGLTPAVAALRLRLGLAITLFALAAVGWWWTAGEMRGMDMGPWTGLGDLGWFVGVWLVMMAAMMLPSVAPTVALYARMTRRRSPISPLAFTAGYLLTWTAAGVVAFALADGASWFAGDALAWDNAGRGLAGATLVVAPGTMPSGSVRNRRPSGANASAQTVSRFCATTCASNRIGGAAPAASPGGR
jgi:hypothetical protein